MDKPKRSGRKRKDGPRKPSGDIKINPERDHGTAEIQIMRAYMAYGGDPAKTTTPLDLMHLRGVITQRQYLAGAEFAKAYKRIHKPHPKTSSAERRDKAAETDPTKADVRAEAILGRGMEALKSLSRQHHDEVVNVAVMERHAFPLPIEEARHFNRLNRLITGLEALTKIIG